MLDPLASKTNGFLRGKEYILLSLELGNFANHEVSCTRNTKCYAVFHSMGYSTPFEKQGASPS
jgi:hypothetical protein